MRSEASEPLRPLPSLERKQKNLLCEPSAPLREVKFPREITECEKNQREKISRRGAKSSQSVIFHAMKGAERAKTRSLRSASQVTSRPGSIYSIILSQIALRYTPKTQPRPCARRSHATYLSYATAISNKIGVSR